MRAKCCIMCIMFIAVSFGRASNQLRITWNNNGKWLLSFCSCSQSLFKYQFLLGRSPNINLHISPAYNEGEMGLNSCVIQYQNKRMTERYLSKLPERSCFRHINGGWIKSISHTARRETKMWKSFRAAVSHAQIFAVLRSAEVWDFCQNQWQHLLLRR